MLTVSIVQKSRYDTYCPGTARDDSGTPALTTAEVVVATTASDTTDSARPSGGSTGAATRGTGLSLCNAIRAALLGALFIGWL